MKYVSTSGGTEPVAFAEAIRRSIAPDGGMYMPGDLPKLPRAFFNNMGEMSLREIAYVVAATFLGEDLDPSALKKIVDEAFAFDAPLVQIADDTYVLELYHGPTLTVKDYSARFMAGMLRHFSVPGKPCNILVATTGNTGAAVANAFYKAEGVNVFVLYPKGRLSRMAISQVTALGENVHPVEVGGTIEDCKRMVDAAIADSSMESLGLTAANSINIARVLPLVSLAFHAAARLDNAGVDASKAAFAIPSGNLSILAAAAMARRMGLQTGPLIGATNANGTLGRLLAGKAVDSVAQPVRTYAPAIDMAYPSGWPRLLNIYGGDTGAMRADIAAAPAVGDMEIAYAVNLMRQTSAYTLDPHAAVALCAARRAVPDAAKLIFATGHPAKQLDIMTRITGGAIELPVQLTRFMSVRRHPAIVPPTLPAIKKVIMNYN